jgi:hypothetical protein
MFVVGVASAVPLAACGSSDGSGSSPPQSMAPLTATAVVLDPFYGAGGTESQATLILTAGCAALSPIGRSYDSYSFNGDIYGLFSGSGPMSQGDGIRRDPVEVDQTIIDACAAHQSDPSAFLDQVSAALRLSATDMHTVIDDACSRFGAWEQSNLTDPNAPDSFDLVPPAIVAALGDALKPATMVDQYCEATLTGASTPSAEVPAR